MSDQLMRRKEVEKMIGASRSSIYLWMQRGIFPRPVRVGLKSVRWRRSAVEGWIKAQEAAG